MANSRWWLQSLVVHVWMQRDSRVSSVSMPSSKSSSLMSVYRCVSSCTQSYRIPLRRESYNRSVSERHLIPKNTVFKKCLRLNACLFPTSANIMMSSIAKTSIHFKACLLIRTPAATFVVEIVRTIARPRRIVTPHSTAKYTLQGENNWLKRWVQENCLLLTFNMFCKCSRNLARSLTSGLYLDIWAYGSLLRSTVCKH